MGSNADAYYTPARQFDVSNATILLNHTNNQFLDGDNDIRVEDPNNERVTTLATGAVFQATHNGLMQRLIDPFASDRAELPCRLDLAAFDPQWRVTSENQ